MRLINKMIFGVAALGVATAASFPHGLGDRYLNGTHPNDILKREALKLCQQESRSFVSFVASERDQCYGEMRGISMASTFSGVWSKPDRTHMPVSQD